MRIFFFVGILALLMCGACNDPVNLHNRVSGHTVPKESSNPQWAGIFQFGSSEKRSSTRSISAEISGSIYVAASAWRPSDAEVDSVAVLKKLNAAGMEQWSKTIGSPSDSKGATQVLADSSGVIYLAGGTTEGSRFLCDETPSLVDAFVKKFDSSGNEIWNVNFSKVGSPTDIIEMVVDSAHNLYVAIVDKADCGSPAHSKIVKLSPDGNQLWSIPLVLQDPLLPSVSITAIRLDPSGNLYVAFSAGDGNIDTAASVYKFNSSGTQIGNITLADPSSASYAGVNAMAVDALGNIYLNFLKVPVNESYSYLDEYLTKYDSQGNGDWITILPTVVSSSARMATDSIGNLYVAGSTSMDGITLTKLDQNGRVRWHQTVQGPPDAITYVELPALSIDSFDNLFVGGTTNADLGKDPRVGLFDAFVVKFSPIGNRL